MDPEALDRALRNASAATLLLAAPLWLLSPLHGLGFVMGGLWSSTNLWVLKSLLESILQDQSKWKIFFWANLKMPLLYGIGALILYNVPLSVGAGILGFHLPFVFILTEVIFRGDPPSSDAPGRGKP